MVKIRFNLRKKRWTYADGRELSKEQRERLKDAKTYSLPNFLPAVFLRFFWYITFILSCEDSFNKQPQLDVLP